MGIIRQADVARVTERYIRIYSRRSMGVLDAASLAARLHSKLPEEQANNVSRDDMVSLVIARAVKRIAAMRW